MSKNRNNNVLVTIAQAEHTEFVDQIERSYQEEVAKLVGKDGSEIPLTDAIFDVLKQILPALQSGRATVTIAPASRELSSQEAADILNVSRPHLIKLLDRGEIPYVKTGTHRRIKMQDLMDYKEKRDSQRRNSLDELTELMGEEGLFD